MNKKNILLVLMIIGSAYAQDTTMQNKSAKHSWWQAMFSRKAKLDQHTFENKFEDMENLLQAHLDTFIKTLQNIEADEKSIEKSQESIAQSEEQIKRQVMQGPEKEKALRVVDSSKKTIEEGRKKLELMKERLNQSKKVIEKSLQELEHMEDEVTEAIWVAQPEEDVQAQKEAHKTLKEKLQQSIFLQGIKKVKEDIDKAGEEDQA